MNWKKKKKPFFGVDAAPPRVWAGIELPQAWEQVSDKYSLAGTDSEPLPSVIPRKIFSPH